MARPLVRRLLRLLLIAALALPVLVVAALPALDIPRNAAGMAAKGVCSAAFVAQRPVDGLLEADVLPASPVLGMLSYKLAYENDLDFSTPVVDTFAGDRAPAWVATWRQDARKTITVPDLMYMRDGMASHEQ